VTARRVAQARQRATEVMEDPLAGAVLAEGQFGRVDLLKDVTGLDVSTPAQLDRPAPPRP
jgi:hypothetical protein